MSNILDSLLNRKSKIEKILSEEVLQIGQDVLNVGHLVGGCCILGSTSSGKTSGPAKALLKSIFRKGYGGFFPVVKQGESERIQKIAIEAGREKDLVIFNENSGLNFSFLEYELLRTDRGAGENNNLVNLLLTITELAKNYEASSAEESEIFWKNAVLRLIRRMVSLIRLAKEPLSIRSMREILVNSFNEDDVRQYSEIWALLKDPNTSDEKKEDAWKDYQSWISQNYFLDCFDKANSADLSAEEMQEMELIGSYWLKELPSLSEKSSSIIREYFLGMAEPFLSGILLNYFSKGVSPELMLEKTYTEGRIIIADFPVKTYQLSGVLACGLMRHLFQTTIERRNVEKEPNPKPVLLYVDEYQALISPQHDAAFQSTCRESMCMTTYISQSINSIIFAMGKHSPQEKAKSLLNNLTLKIFCANADETNDWAAAMIGKHMAETTSISIGGDKNSSRTVNQMLHYKIPPEVITALKTGRGENNYKVEAILFKPGKKWKSNNNQNFMLAEFDQRD